MKLRPATMEDARILFEWRNDDITRRMSFNSDFLDWNSHVLWLSKRLSRQDHGLYIAEEIDAVGMIGIDKDEISYTVSPIHRGRGVATAMLTLAREQFGEKLARIKVSNQASIAVASKTGHRILIVLE